MITVGLVLAAGRSTRFGETNKLLASLDGKPLASHVAQAMAAVPLTHRIVVLADPAVARLFPDHDIITPESERNTQGANLALGAKRAVELGAERLLIALGDMPLVDAALLRAVLERCTDKTASATGAGAWRSPPVCFPKRDLKALTAISGDTGARSLLAALPDSQIVSAPEAMLHDIDTRDDLAQLKR